MIFTNARVIFPDAIREDLAITVGAGKITELSGTGRDVKAVIEFDDATVGRKTIKLAYTTLERGQG